ncbi:SgcJ/EcaC family oxidoreductase [Paenibacillus sp. MWE-103]|uniref:SgcJ/EcaC family oxidoreductase n=1 Tax=Paenibacillus artemisiicola TaxID=1172618 RepID=A0ABS3WHQ7_9BACL|nr:SgcJ/EcaC family oxidoreductase [Paenibacillus artemisiicola]MBO7747833.1 SgcJ/EcaC family oxidoreductase [Paenibacillus artemisiicola]
MSASSFDYVLQQYAESRAAHDRTPRPDELEIVRLYAAMLAGWNDRSAEAMAAPFAEEGELIGFDGSEASGRAGILAHLAPIFAHHKTPRYCVIVASVKLIAADAAILRAYSGLVPDGAADIDPKLNAQHALTAAKREGRWAIALFQNTPAQFHMEPERGAEITAALRALLPIAGLR